VKTPLRVFLIGAVLAAVAVPLWPYRFTATPACTLRVVDQTDHAVTNITVTRSWRTSEGQRDEEDEITDANGSVSFDRETATIPLIQRIVRPLLGFVPSPCGPDSEFYQLTEFRVRWPEGYTLKFDDKAWRHVQTIYRNRDGVCIRDPQYSKRERRDTFAMITPPDGGPFQFVATNRVETYAELYFFNRERDFDFTLQVHKPESR
jgi:hypothetical protein